jgi:hypothetical protein
VTRPDIDDVPGIAELWQPALAASWRLGYAHGYPAGYSAAEAAMASAWHEMWQATRTTLTTPAHAELAALRAPTDSPCNDTRCDTCSRCIRAHAVRDNVRRYGTPFYPGKLAAVVT